MAPPPRVSPATGNPVPPSYLHTAGVHFQDNHGRSVLLRGVNLSGGAKAPVSQPAQRQKGFWEDAEEGKGDWVNCTLNLDDGSAEVHLARLRAWGYNVLRFVFTWEALEHEGPGKYDYDYMEYVVKCLYKCKEFGFRVYMDPHQDVWSRFSGGSGAPLWTIYACGIDPHALVPTYSALVECDYPSRESPDPQSLPPMIWASNYYRAFGHTVWTLFFAGHAFAPKCIIDGVNIQDWLQNHFIDAVAELAKFIAKFDGLYEECILGWDSINEPGEGLIRLRDLSVVPKHQPVVLGPVPTPFENMQLAMGRAVTVPVYTFGSMGPAKTGTTTLDPKGTKLWLAPEDEATRGGGKWGWKRDPGWQLGTCIWAQHGVWDVATCTLQRPDYFLTFPSDPQREVDFVPDFWRQHFLSYASSVRKFHPEAILFMNTTVFKPLPELPESFLAGRACSTAHFYDGLTLMTKHWNWFNADALGILRGKYWSVVQGLRIGEASIRTCIQEQLGVIKQDTKDSIGDYPTLIGEIGCPYDMDDRKAYGFVDNGKGKGDYTSQQRAWDASMNASDGPNCLNYTLWTYVPNNSHEWGDNWNGEDLSLWSADDMKLTSLSHQQYSSSESMTEATRLASDSLASSQTLQVIPYTPKGIESGREVTPELILNGARAVGAVCRPYPVATVGVPHRIDFDISSTVFRFSVRVGPQDTAAGGPTEIYVPYVHYASKLDWGDETSSSSSRTTTDLSVSTGSLVSDSDSDDDLKKLGANNPMQLDIEVKTTVGSWIVQGQTLRWAYPIPQHETLYTIEIRRRGGVLAHNVVSPPPSMVDDLYEYFGCTIS